jgi:hemoglobin-like flavoprotein
MPACPALADTVARERLRHSFALAINSGDAFGEVFYRRLFELAPAARSLFPAQLGPQQHKLTQALHTLLRSLELPEALIPTLRNLGARHQAYGAEPAHYAVVGEALLDTLDQTGPAELDVGTRTLWMQFYGWVAAVMLEGAEQGHARAGGAPRRTKRSQVVGPPATENLSQVADS